MGLITGTTVERYVIEGVIGEGAMAVVYRARHKDLGSLHAIKQLTNSDPETRHRLVQEGRLQSTLKHSNVISVTDLVEIDGLPALVMEYVPGPTLRDLIVEKCLNLQQTDAIVEGLLNGVSAAHAHGLVHRDLKPANIMIEVTAQGLVPKIADFGLAKVLMPEETSVLATRTGWAMGTPAYMAPEQIQDSSSVDARADVFSLGAILYELVTGTRCFPAKKRVKLWQDICAGNYEPLDQRQPDTPTRMVRAVDGALRTALGERIPSVSELSNVWFDGETLHASLDAEARMQLWPDALRSKATGMASDVVALTDPTDSGSLEFDQTMAAAHGPVLTSDSTPSSGLSGTVAAGDKLEPISGSISPSAGAQDELGRASQSAPAQGRAQRSSFASLEVLAGLGVILMVAIWALTSDAPAAEQPPGEPEPAALVKAPPTPAPAPAPATPVFALRNAMGEGAQSRLNTAVDALMFADVVQAERILRGLVAQHKHEPVVHSLLAVCHYLRGRGGLSARESAWAARLARDERSELERFIVLSDTSWRESALRPALRAQWKETREKLAHPVVDAFYFISTRFTSENVERPGLLSASKSRYPSAALLWLTELRVMSERGDDEAVLRASEKALADHPEAPAIGLEKYRAMARLGRLDEAERGLNHVLVQDANLYGARFALAKIHLDQDEEADRMTQMMILLGDTTAPIDQLLFLLEHGHDLAGRGRLSDAKRVWDLCAREAADSRHFTTGLGCAWGALDAMDQLGVKEDASAWVEKIRTALTQPEIDSTIREHYSVLLLWDEARRALGSSEPSKAKELMARLQKFKAGDLPFGMGEWLAETIRFELLLQGGDEARLQAQLDEWASVESAASSHHASCERAFRASRLQLRLKHKDASEASLKRFLDMRCRPLTLEGQVRLDLASLHHEKRDVAGAKGHLDTFLGSWPRADEGLPLLKKAQALKAALPGGAPRVVK